MKIFKIMAISALSISLFACANQVSKGDAKWTLFGPSNASQSAKSSLASENIKVVHIGDYLRLIIPSSQLFVGQGPELTDSAGSTLQAALNYIQSIPKIRVDVAAYTYKAGSQRLDQKLTQLQADAVVDYFLDHGLDARFVTARGMGFKDLVTNNPNELSDDYRVEITLKSLNPKLPG